MTDIARGSFLEAIEPPKLAGFQREAVVRLDALLTLRDGAILADEPGLGKSWVAAALARRAIERGKSVEVIAPAPLVAQWRRLLERFGVDAPVVSHEKVARADPEPGSRSGWLIIVDEAHRFRNRATIGFRALALRSVGAKLLLVTATPICNSPDDLETLVRLIASDDALSRAGVESIGEAFERRDAHRLAIVVDELVVRRSRVVLPDQLRPGRLGRRAIRYSVLGEREAGIADSIQSLHLTIAGPRSARETMRRLLWRRLESSRAALRGTARRLARVNRRAREALLEGRVVRGSDYRRVFGDPDDSVFQDVLFPDLWGLRPPDGELNERDLARDARILESIVDSLRGEPKAGLISEAAQSHVGRGLVFTISRETADSLWNELSPAFRCGLVTGAGCRTASGNRASMEAVLAELERGRSDLVVSTDVGAEGLDLQCASLVIHADLPWSPARIEQRLGRVWRIGQVNRVEEVFLLPEDETVWGAVARKDQIRKLLLDVGRGVSQRSDEAIGWIESGEATWLVSAAEREEVVAVLEGDSAFTLLTLGASTIDSSQERAYCVLFELWGAGVSAAPRRDRTRVENCVAALDVRAAERGMVPSRISRCSPQFRILEALAKAGTCGEREVGLLSGRYRAGGEIVIAESCSGPIGRSALERLMRLLEAELAVNGCRRLQVRRVIAGCRSQLARAMLSEADEAAASPL